MTLIIAITRPVVPAFPLSIGRHTLSGYSLYCMAYSVVIATTYHWLGNCCGSIIEIILTGPGINGVNWGKKEEDQ